MILMYDMESSIYDVHKNDRCYDHNIFTTIFVQNKLQLILRQIRTCKMELEFCMLAFPGNQVFTAK